MVVKKTNNNKPKKNSDKKTSDKKIIEMSNAIMQRNLDVYRELAK